LINDPFHFENDPSILEGFFIYSIAGQAFNDLSKSCKARSFQSKSPFNEKGHCVWHLWGMKSLKNKDDYSKYGDEAPRLKDIVIVVVVFIILTMLGYLAWELFKI
jgi:hypothetical protein